MKVSIGNFFFMSFMDKYKFIAPLPSIIDIEGGAKLKINEEKRSSHVLGRFNHVEVDNQLHLAIGVSETCT